MYFTPTVIPAAADAPPSPIAKYSNVSTAQQQHGPRPSPPSRFKTELSGDCLLVLWRRPDFDANGRSNGFLVIGYTIKCDGVIHKGVGETNRFTKLALLEEVDPHEPHTISICTQSEEGVASTEIVIQYDYIENEPVSITRNSAIRSSQRSEDSIDSDILKTKLMVAVHDYAPSVDSPNPQPELELAFTKGQFITIYGDMREDGFFFGEAGGVCGLVPSNFVTDLDFEDYDDKHALSVSMTINPAYAQTPPRMRKNEQHRKNFLEYKI